MTTRAAALEAVYTAAQAIVTTFDGPRQSGTPYVPVPVHLLVALRAAVEGVVGEPGPVLDQLPEAFPPPTADEQVAAAEALAALPARGLCQGDPHCFRYADLPGGTCHHHGPYAALESGRVVMRDEVFRGETDD